MEALTIEKAKTYLGNRDAMHPCSGLERFKNETEIHLRHSEKIKKAEQELRFEFARFNSEEAGWFE